MKTKTINRRPRSARPEGTTTTGGPSVRLALSVYEELRKRYGNTTISAAIDSLLNESDRLYYANTIGDLAAALNNPRLIETAARLGALLTVQYDAANEALSISLRRVDGGDA